MSRLAFAREGPLAAVLAWTWLRLAKWSVIRQRRTTAPCDGSLVEDSAFDHVRLLRRPRPVDGDDPQTEAAWEQDFRGHGLELCPGRGPCGVVRSRPVSVIVLSCASTRKPFGRSATGFPSSVVTRTAPRIRHTWGIVSRSPFLRLTYLPPWLDVRCPTRSFARLAHHPEKNLTIGFTTSCVKAWAANSTGCSTS